MTLTLRRPRAVARAGRRAARGLFDALAEVGGARLYPPSDAREAAHRLAAAVGAIARAHELAVTAHGDVPRTPALVVTQRVGHLDALALLPICPALPIAPADALTWPVVGALASAFGVPVVARADPMARARTLRRVHALLAAGVSVCDVALPTGAFRRGAFGVAARLRVPIVPVAVRYADPDDARGPLESATRHALRVAARPHVAIELHFGAPLWAREGEPAEVLADRARHRIARLSRLAPLAAAPLRVA